MRPTRSRWLPVLTAVAAVLVLVAGSQLLADRAAAPRPLPEPIAGSDTTPDTTPDAAPSPVDGAIVPWALRLAAEPPMTADWSATPSGLPACDDLSATAGTPTAESRGETRMTVTVRNGGPRCQLPAYSEGRLLDAEGNALPRSPSSRWGVGRPEPPPLEAGAEAATVLSWQSWCGDDLDRWSIELEVGGAVPVAVPDDAPLPPCRNGVRGAGYGFSDWTVLNEHGQPARDPQQALRATVSGPDEGRLGEVLPMVLRLENPSRGPVPLDPCPAFVWSVSTTGAGSFLRSSPMLELNCPAAPDAVPAGGSVSFALELVLAPALADGMLTPGTWWVYPAAFDLQPRQITVLPAGSGAKDPAATCTWVVPPDADPRVTGLPPAQAPREERTAVLRTNRGEITMTLDGTRSPCAVEAFAHLARGGFWSNQPCHTLSASGTFRNVDCGAREIEPRRVGFGFSAEVQVGQDYPAGTVVLTHNESVTHAGTIRILYGDAPTYADNFTILGRVTAGLEVVEQVAAGGQRDGEYGGPRLPLTISSVELR